MTIDEGFRALAKRLDIVAQILREILAELRERPPTRNTGGASNDDNRVG